MHDRIGKYQIKRELGKGGSSVVYLAFDEFYNCDVALKVYRSESGPTLSDYAPEVAGMLESSRSGKRVPIRY